MNEYQIRADFEKSMQEKYGWNNTLDILANPDNYSEAVYIRVYYAWEGWHSALASQANNMLPNQEPLGSEFEKVLYENLDSLYETGDATQLSTGDRVRELEAKILDLPRYSFLSPIEGGVRRYADTSGAWIERWEVIRLFEAMKEANK